LTAPIKVMHQGISLPGHQTAINRASATNFAVMLVLIDPPTPGARTGRSRPTRRASLTFVSSAARYLSGIQVMLEYFKITDAEPDGNVKPLLLINSRWSHSRMRCYGIIRPLADLLLRYLPRARCQHCPKAFSSDRDHAAHN
jgi:hypothetical protein